MNRRNKTWLMLALLLAVLPAIAGDTMYARTSTTLRADRTLSAEVLGRIEQGDAVTVLDRSGRHYRVSAGGVEGWVYYNKLSEEKPEDVGALLISSPSAGGIRLTEMEAGGAVRGLSTAAERYAGSANAPPWALRAVEEMQEVRVGPAELEDFARQGGLGEYGGER